MSIGTRLRALMEYRGESVKQFADLTDIPIRSLYEYLKDERLPGCEVLLKIGTMAGADLNWLVLGLGEMCRSPATPEIQPEPAQRLKARDIMKAGHPGPPRPLELPRLGSVMEHLRALGEDAGRELGLGFLVNMAGIGRKSLAWHAICALASGAELTLDELLVELVDPERDVGREELEPVLSYLLHIGLVERVGHRWRQVQGLGVLVATAAEPSNVAEAGLEAVRQIVRVVVPASEVGSGKVVAGTVWVPSGEGREVVKEIANVVQRRWKELAETDIRDGEEVTLVLGLAVSDKSGNTAD